MLLEFSLETLSAFEQFHVQIQYRRDHLALTGLASKFHLSMLLPFFILAKICPLMRKQFHYPIYNDVFSEKKWPEGGLRQAQPDKKEQERSVRNDKQEVLTRLTIVVI
jgi:hypothetical protein